MEFHRMPGHLIRRLHQISTQVFQSHLRLAGLDVTQVQFAAMDAIGAHPGIDQAGVASLIFYDRATIGGVIDRLVSKGLVERAINPSDRRGRTLSLTPAGQSLLEDMLPIVIGLQDDITVGLTEDERKILMALLSKAVEGREED